jgi:hypothetical protein
MLHILRIYNFTPKTYEIFVEAFKALHKATGEGLLDTKLQLTSVTGVYDQEKKEFSKPKAKRVDIKCVNGKALDALVHALCDLKIPCDLLGT